jgi:hypothetical protein
LPLGHSSRHRDAIESVWIRIEVPIIEIAFRHAYAQVAEEAQQEELERE